MRRVVVLRCMLLIILLPLVCRSQNVISTIVGGGSPLGPPPPPNLLTTSLGAPTAMVQGLDGSFYVSSRDGGFVFKIDGNQDATVFAGTGFSGFAGVGGLATSATLTAPSGLAFDSNRNLLLIADALNHHIYQVDLGTGILTDIAGSASPASPFGGFGGDGGPATQAQLNGPQSVALFNTTIYIADTGNNRVRQIDTATGTITTIAGTGVACPDPAGVPPTCGDTGLATQATLTSPSGVAVDTAGNVYIADTLDNRVREIDINTGLITTIAGTGAPCVPLLGCGDGGPPTLANLTSPTAVFVDTQSNIYIIDQGDQTIRLVDDTGNISTFAGNGSMGFTGDGLDPTVASLSNPTGVFVVIDGQGVTTDVFIVDQGNNRIRDVTPNPNPPPNQIISTFAGGGLGGDNGAPLNSVFANAYDLALDAANNLFIIDFGNSRLRKVAGGVVTNVAGIGTAGFGGNGGFATIATLNYPRGVAVTAGGTIFIADADNNVVRTVQKNNIAAYAGSTEACSPPTAVCGDGGLANSADLNKPNGVAVGANGDVFIADTGDNRIRMVDHTTLRISTVAGTGVPCAVPKACGDGGQATLAELNAPTGIAVDTAGNVFIADSGDNVIRKIDAATQVITTVAFNGQATFSGDGGPATLASMAAPNKVVVDPRGNLYIGGGLDKVVRRVDGASQTVITVAGNAQQPLAFGFSGDAGVATSATLANRGLAINATGALYIADNNRIRFVQLAPSTATAPRNVSFGNQAVGVASVPFPVTLTNPGTDDLLISSIVDANGFSQTNNCPIAPAPLAPLQTCTINVTFTPAVAGPVSDLLTITDNAFGSPHTVPLAGVGQSPFSLTTTCTSLTVVQGQSAIYTVDLAPAAEFTQSVSLSCSGAPALATCTVNPSAMTLDGATTVHAKVTATTTPATSGLLKSLFGRPDGNRMAGLVGLAGMAGLAALVILPGKGRRKHARLCGLVFCLCMLASVATMSSCGVGGGGVDPPGTAPGTYPLTVTATFKSATGTTFTQSVSFDLVVK